MKRHLIFILITICCLNNAFAADKKGEYKIEIVAPQLKNKKIHLAVHFYGKLYAKDSVLLDNKGTGSFQKQKGLEEGMYAVYFSNSKYFDMLIADDQNFKIEIDTTDLVKKVNITGAEQSEGFNNFVKFISQKRAEVASLKTQNVNTKDSIETKKIIKEKTEAIDKEVSNYQKNLIQTYGNKTLGVVLKAITPPEMPDLKAENDSILQITRYYYNRAHFFDNINLSDPRLLYTSILSDKIDFYLNKIVPQIPDTLTTEVVNLVEKSKGDTLTFQNMLSNMLNYAIKNNMMGMDRLVLTLSEKYYLSGQATWADSTLLKDLKKEVQKTKYNQIGSKAVNLTVETLKGEKISVLNLKEDYILLYFFEPSCGHCKKETPILYDQIYQKYKDKNFEIVAFYIQSDKKEWQDFIDEHKLYDWVNVWDPSKESYFWYFYDTTTTPGLYLLDKNRKIIAKRIDVETLDMILGKELEKDKKTAK